MSGAQLSAPLPAGDVVFVPAVRRFGRIAGTYQDPHHGLIYVVHAIDARPEMRKVYCLPEGIWHYPLLNDRPLCHLAPHGSRA